MVEETKVNWADWVKKRLTDSAHKSNLKHGKIAWCNAFYAGDQYRIMDELTGAVRDVNIKRETRCIYNICKLFADVYVAKMLKGDPLPFVTPYSTNTEDYDEDISAAANAAVEYWWKTETDGASKLKHAVRQATIGGIGFAKVVYDKAAKSGIYDGVVTWERVNPLHVFANADAQSDEEFREVIHRFPKEKAVAEDEFAEQMKKLGIKELTAQTKSEADVERNDMRRTLDGMNDAEVEATVLVHDIWMKASKKYPKGKHIIVIGNDVLVDEDNPEPDMVPFFAYRVEPLDDDLYGQGKIYPIIRIQRDMNRLSSTIMENSSQMGHAKWMVPNNANVLPGSLDNASGEKVFFDGDRPPQQSQVTPLPAHITNRFWDLFRVAQGITKLQDLGMGMIPYRGSQVATGVMQELRNSEDVVFAPDVADLVAFVRKIVRRYLYLARKYYQEERIVTVLGENKRPEGKVFKSSNLANDYDADIKVGGGFAKSDDAQLNQIISLTQAGFFDRMGADMRVVGEEVLKKVGLNKIKEDTFKDERQAKRYLNMILAGESPVVSKFVNPLAHIKIFTNFVKQPQYDVLPLKIKAGVDKYIDMMVGMTQGATGNPPQGGNGAPGTPGNMPPQMPTQEEAMAAESNRHLATGQPVVNEGQAETAPQGV